jgi:hypothetical protein
MWLYDRGCPWMVSTEAERTRSEHVSESRIRSAETRNQLSDEARPRAAGGGGGARCEMSTLPMISYTISMCGHI